MKTFKRQFTAAGLLLFAILIMPVDASAENMYLTHGNDYEYTIGGDAFFPVVWDIRNAWMNYLGYARYYKNWEDPRAFDYADRELSGVLLQAKNAGVNSVIIRGSLGADVRNQNVYYFPGRADMIRDLGLNLIPGGFGHILNATDFNVLMKQHIESYLSEPIPPGYASVVGIHGFNEPDVVYDAEDDEGKGNIEDALSSYHTWSNNLGLPLSSFMAMPAAYVPSLAEPHNSTGDDATIYQLCSRLDFPMLDWYPARTFSGTCNSSVPEADIWGATDLIPTDVSSNHYYAYNTRDELWSLDHDVSSGNTTFRVYEVTGEEQIGVPGFTQIFTSQPGLSWPFKVASSDYRASDIGDRRVSEHNQNAAVVMYHLSDQIEQAEVVIHNGTSLLTVNPPNLNEAASTVLFCVGEDNYSTSDLAVNGNTGIIGRAGMRILWCGNGVSGAQLVRKVWILEKNSSGNGLTNTISAPLILPGSFTPTGAVWGYFWNGTHPNRKSGFVLYNNAGNYAVVYVAENGVWEVSSVVHTGLFGNGINPGAVIAYRETTWPVTSYSPAKDILCAIVNEPFSSAMNFHWCNGDGTTMEMGLNPHGFYIHDETASDYNHLSFGHCWHMNKTNFFFGGDEADCSYYTQEFKHFPTDQDGTGGWAAESNPGFYDPPWGVVNSPMRVRHTRKAWVYALMPNPAPDADIISIRDGEITEDNGVTSSEVASTDLYFNNLCSPGDNGFANENGAIDLEFEWGINQTTEDNCLFANIQAFGKFPMLAASFPPSHNTGPTESDTLLYLTVAPIVHGCRGISFYALDMALQSGPAISGSSAPLYGAPNVLLNWGPSRDCEVNADIVGRVHDVAKMLTGKKGGPDFLNALVNHSDFTVLDETEAVYAYLSGQGSYVPADDYILNFIALQEDFGGDILLLVSYDGDVGGYAAPLIVFPNEYACDFGPLECWGGWDPSTVIAVTDNIASASMHHSITEIIGVDKETSDSPLSKPVLGISLENMPPHTVSLIRIPSGGADGSVSSMTSQPVLQVRRSAGSVILQLSGEFDNCDLSLYDIMGRKVEEIEIPEVDGHDVVLDVSSRSAGKYFVVLRDYENILQMEKISIF